MLHPSYTDLMKIINGDSEGDTPVVNSRYSIVLATAKRARQLIDGVDAKVTPVCPKPLSVAVQELEQSQIRILSEEEAEALEKEQKEKEEQREMENQELFGISEDL